MPLNILFLSNKFYPDIGGIEVNSEILATAFVKAGHNVKLLTWTNDVGEKSFPFKVIRNPGLRELFTHHHWANVVFENNPCMRLVWPAIFFKKPSVVALRTWVARINGEIGWQDRLKTFWLKRASAVIAVSESIRRKCWPAAITIGNPYRNNLFKIVPGIPRIYDFVFLGRLVSDKGASLAIKAIHQLNSKAQKEKQKHEFSLTIIGDGPERENLEVLIAELGIQKIRFKGSLKGEELVYCLNEHRFLLVPSIWEEPFGNVALEGMACGCIPIVSNGGGLPDAVGKAGIVFERGDVDDLVSNILKVLLNAAYDLELRNAASQHLAEHHPDVIAMRYLAVIENSLTADFTCQNL